MMVTTDPDENGSLGSSLASGLRIALGAVVFIFSAGAVIGFGAAIVDSGAISFKGAVAAIALLGSVLLSGWYLARQLLAKAKAAEGPIAASTKSARNLTIASALMGFAIAIVLVIGQQRGAGELPSVLSSGPLSPWAAVALIGFLLTALPWLTWKWHREVDEHEAAAYNFGALVAIYAYSLLSACWWLGWRGGFFPSPDGLSIFFLTYGVWLAVWFWRRSR